MDSNDSTETTYNNVLLIAYASEIVLITIYLIMSKVEYTNLIKCTYMNTPISHRFPTQNGV